MPRIPQYVAQQAPSGSIQGAPARPVDVSGLVHGAASANDTFQRLQQHQEVQRLQLAEDEARVTVANTVSQAHSTWTEKLAAAKQSAPEGAPGFTAGVLKEFDAWSEKAQADAPELGRKIIQQRLAEFRVSMHAKAFEYETAARNDKVVGDYETGLDADRRTVMADPSQFPQLLASRLAVVNTLSLPADRKGKIAEITRERMANDAAAGIVDRTPERFLSMAGMAGGKTGKDGQPLPVDPAKAAAAVKNDPLLQHMKPEDLQRQVERATVLSTQREALRQAAADRAARQAEIETQRIDNEAAQAWNILSARARDGVLTDPVADRPLFDAMSKRPVYSREYAKLAARVPEGNAVAQLPLDTQRKQLDGLYAARNTNGTSIDLESRIKQREKVLSSAERDYKIDPLRAGAERGLIAAVAPLDSTNIDTMIQSIGPRVQQAGVIATRTGVQVSPFTPDEAHKVKNELDALAPAQRSAKVAALSERMGPQAAQGLAAQLDDKDKALALALASGSTQTTNGRYLSELILKGAQAKKDGTSTKGAKAPELKSSQWQANITSQLEGLYPAQTLTDRTRDAAVFIAHGIAAEQGGELSSRDLERAASMAVGGRIVEHNAKRIPLPSWADGDALAKRLKSVSPDEIKAQSGDTVRAGGVAVPVADFVKSLPGAQLMLAGSWRYAVIVNGRPVTNDKGVPVTIPLYSQ